MIEFIEETHTYVNSKGVIIPSVSDLVAFAFGDTYADIDPVILQKAADYGTAVHEILELYDNGYKEKAYEEALGNDDMLNALADYADLKKKWLIYPKSQEQIVCYKDRYAGRYDKLDEMNILWDVKTNSKKYEDKWACQLGLYYMAMGKCNGTGYVIWLPKKKKAQVIELKTWTHDQCKELLDAYERSVQ